MIRKNYLRIFLACSAAFSIGAAHAQFTNWTGGGGNDNWSTAGNWSPGVPVSGASLDLGDSARKNGVNDIAGLSLLRIDFTASGHVITGNGVSITDGLRCANNVDSTLNLPVDMGAGATVVTSRDGIATFCAFRATGGLAGTGTITVGAFTIFAIGGASTFSGQIHLDECRNFGCGRLRLEGTSIPNANVFSTTTIPAGISAELSGYGTVGNATRVSVSPGTTTALTLQGPYGLENGTGVINTKNLDVTARLVNMDLAGAAPGTGYDQVAVTGTVTLGNAVLAVRIGAGAALPPGHVFTIISNDGADAVSGTFSGLAEGAMLTSRGHDLQLSYVGGDGNDVTLTVVNAPKVWTGAAGTLWSNPGNWAGGVVPVNGDRLRFPAGAANPVNTNDITGLTLHSIGFDGKDFVLGGNGVVLTSLVESTFAVDPGTATQEPGTIALPVDVGANNVRVTAEDQRLVIRFGGAISGTGSITMDAGITAFQGTGTYSGQMQLACRTFTGLSSFEICGRVFLEGASLPLASLVAPQRIGPPGFAITGNGTIGSISTVSLSPSASGLPCCSLGSAGILSTGPLSGTSLQVTIVGNAPGSGYDQVRVTGTVDLTGSTLFINFNFPIFFPAPGEVLTLIDNDGTDPVVGRFTGLPNGATVQQLGGPQFRISYIGGDGNDVTLTALPTGPRLVNLSTRMQVLTGDDVLIGGFIIGGTSPKTVLVRARGPSLAAQNIAGALQDPTMALFSGSTAIMANDDWHAAANATVIQASDLAPPDPRESAILMTLAPGAYTAIVSGVGGATGVGMIEVFEVDQPEVPLVNIATRGKVETGDNVMIAGIIIQGTAPQTVVIRARGPSLAGQGVPGVLANPQLTLFSGPTQIGSNDNWQSASNATDIQNSGFAPSDPNESAILTTLAPGAYTAIVSGVGGATGVAIVEVFRN